ADSLFRVGWVPVEPVVVGAVGEVSVLDVAGVSGGGGGGVVEGVHARVVGVLERVREWLAGAGGGDARLVVVSRGAVDVAGSGVSDLAAAAVWGLVRAAQSEHPDRLVLVDTDTDTGADTGTGAGAGAGADLGVGVWGEVAGWGEPQVAVRGGEVFVPRLARVTVPPTEQPEPSEPSEQPELS
ncbi:hypothetical protein WDH52_24470, partial [Streptomyces sp. TRM70308]|uniref:SpnB-like Rossmann fold domain-containing protein n=1 Tax=Streptomyces sp. TRM70308 TaxID=3131932 RepID=UPI003D047179